MKHTIACCRGWPTHFSKRPLPSYRFEDKAFIAVDASKYAGATVELTPEGPRLLFEPII